MDTTFTAVGNLVRDIQLTKVGQNEMVVGSTALAVNRYMGKDREQEVSYFEVTMWGDMASNAANSLNKGQRVIVTGRLQQDTWEDKETQAKRSKVVLVADEIAPSLRWATAEVQSTRRERAKSSDSSRGQENVLVPDVDLDSDF